MDNHYVVGEEEEQQARGQFLLTNQLIQLSWGYLRSIGILIRQLVANEVSV